MGGPQWGKHIGILRIDVPDGRRDVLPEGGAEEGIVARASSAVEKVHVGGRERGALLLVQQ